MPHGTNYWIGLKNKPQNLMGMDLLKFYYNLGSANFLSPDPARPIPTHELRESVQSANPECGEANAFPLGRTESLTVLNWFREHSRQHPLLTRARKPVNASGEGEGRWSLPNLMTNQGKSTKRQQGYEIILSRLWDHQG